LTSPEREPLGPSADFTAGVLARLPAADRARARRRRVAAVSRPTFAVLLGLLGALVGASARAEEYARGLERHVDEVGRAARRLARRPRVWFEEWDDPLISGIEWVAELVRIAGGDDVFPELAAARLAKDRIVADPAEVVRRRPDVIFASWCGKKFVPARVAARPGWDALPAVRDGELHDVPSPLILQPGPAALTDGLDALHSVIARWAGRAKR
jgi:iron complex transport system substrate-binding protein